MNESKLIYQCDRNYGLLGGWLESVVYESMPGYWELKSSRWIPSQLVSVR